jgi:hypothetical protein
VSARADQPEPAAPSPASSNGVHSTRIEEHRDLDPETLEAVFTETPVHPRSPAPVAATGENGPGAPVWVGRQLPSDDHPLAQSAGKKQDGGLTPWLVAGALLLGTGAAAVASWPAPAEWVRTQLGIQAPVEVTTVQPGADDDRKSLAGKNLEGAEMPDAKLGGADLTGTILTRANLRGADLARAQLVGVRMERADLQRSYLRAANMEAAILTGAKLQSAYLQRAVLNLADLTRAQLGGANLSGARLDGANLTRADLRGANLEDASLDGAVLTGAEYDENTSWPAGFDPKMAGALFSTR